MDRPGSVKDGPSPAQREAMIRFNAKLEAEKKAARGRSQPTALPAAAPSEVKRLNKAASRFLETNDKPSERLQFVNRKRKERAARKNRIHRIR